MKPKYPKMPPKPKHEGRTRIGKFTTCGEPNQQKDLKTQNPFLHSDQGWQYQMVGYQAIFTRE